jgi:hypothetical protein
LLFLPVEERQIMKTETYLILANINMAGLLVLSQKTNVLHFLMGVWIGLAFISLFFNKQDDNDQQ